MKKKQKTLTENLYEKIKEVLKENLKINYMILPRRTLLTSENFFIDIFTNFLINIYSESEENLLNIYSNLNSNKTSFIFSKSLSKEILLKCFSTKYISLEFEKVWEKLDVENMEFENLLKEIDKQFKSIDPKLSSKIEDEALYVYKLGQFKRKEFFIKDTFLLIKDDDMDYIYTTADNLNLGNIRSFSFYIKNKKNYKIIVLSNDFFSARKSEIEEYKNTRVYGLSEIKNPFLLTYLCNNMTSLDYGDLNITYFYGDELNPYKINASIRYKRNYKIINYDNLSDFDLNLLDGDIITLGGKLSGVVTVTNVKVGRFTYRVLIIRKNGIYFLNFRKVEGIPYEIEELEEKSGVDIRNYLIPEDNTNPKVWFDTDYKLKHFDIDFPLGYQQQDIDVVFSKLVSSSKGTFWINGKTNSWKSTSLKNLLLSFYEYNKKQDTNKNVFMIENPIEGFDYYFKQIEVDDEDVEDYKSIIMGIKRADLDLCVFGELRTYDVFGIFNEVSNSLPVVSTFHVGTAESFLSMLKYYCDKTDLNRIDVFGGVNTSIVQIPLETEKTEEKNRDYYTNEEKNDLLNNIYSRFRLNEEDIAEEEQQFKNILTEIIDKMFEKGKYPIKNFSNESKPQLYYEILTGDMLSLYLNKGETAFSEVYKYLGYTNNILYKTFISFIEGEMTFDNVKIDEYSFKVRQNTLEKVKLYLDQI